MAKEEYSGPFIPWGIAQTILRAQVEPHSQPPYRRERLQLSDGGCVGLDWLEPEGPLASSADVPIVLVLPGLTGSSSEGYVISLLCHLRPYRRLVFNNRGNGGEPLLTKQVYSAAWTGDLAEVVAHLRRLYPETPLLAVGFSLGGMILANYLARSGTEAGISGAVTISSPWSPVDSTKTLEALIPRKLFNERLTSLLLQLANKYRGVIGDSVDWEKLNSARTIREFDTAWIVPLFGYRDVWEYYEDAALAPKADKIRVPTICINAADDPFAPIHSIPRERIAENPNLGVIITETGGHIAFLRSLSTGEPSLVHLLVSQFAEALFNRLPSISSPSSLS